MIDAGPNPESTTYIALNEIRGQLQKEGVECEIVHTGGQNVEGGRFCNSCKKTGRCVLDDCLNPLLERAAEADAYIFASQSHYGVANGNLALLIHRFITADLTCVGKPVATVVTCRRSGATAALDQMNKYMADCNMPIVPSQYWNVVHGNTPDEVRQDTEGLQTMRVLARNMAWLLKCIALGREHGIGFPAHEQHTMTNFIR